MGQRSQIYIKMENIGKTWAKRTKLDKPKDKKWRDNLPEYVKAQELYDKWKLMYGEGDTIILAFHHQWLYGRSFVLTASRLLFLSKACYDIRRPENNMFSTLFWKEERPYDSNKLIDFENPNTLMEFVENYLSQMFDHQLSKYTRAGIERFTNLNEEHTPTDTWRYDDSVLHGDNNDGVLIVDFTTQKYCFMEVNNSEYKQEFFPHLQPVSADNYLKMSYSEVALKESDSTTEVTNEQAAENKNINTLFNERFTEYSVLSVEEIIAMFPEMKEKLIKANKPKKAKKVKA